MATVETIKCKGCNQPVPGLSYAKPRCPECQREFNSGFASARNGKAATPMIVAGPSTLVIPQKMASAPAIANEPTAGYASKIEARYADQLEALRLSGEIRSWRYEPIKFKLADKTYYKPDFMVVMPDGRIEFHEVKGSWKAPHQEDARVKIKTVAAMFREFRFVAVVKHEGDWQREEFS